MQTNPDVTEMHQKLSQGERKITNQIDGWADGQRKKEIQTDKGRQAVNKRYTKTEIER